MSHRYFFSVEFIAVSADPILLMERCISVMHCYPISSEQAIGVTFPRWNERSIGNVIAFVSSSKSLLKELYQQEYFHDMAIYNVFNVSDISLVPEFLPDMRFIRNQNIAKCFAGEKRRRAERARKRAIERGEDYRPNAELTSTEILPFHKITMNSKSKKQRFILHIQIERNVFRENDTFNSYGLSSNELHRGTVPDLSKFLYN